MGLDYNYSLTCHTDIFGTISFESLDPNSTFANASARAEENGNGLMIGGTLNGAGTSGGQGRVALCGN